MWRSARAFQGLILSIAVVAAFGAKPALAHHPDTITFTTENYPPFNMQDAATGRIVGISTDILRALVAQAGIPYRISFLPWQRAFNDALTKPLTCVYSTTETEERLPKFKWVGPLVRNDWIFFGRKNDSLQIKSLDDARAYVIGGYKGDAVALFLERMGFEQDLAAFDHINPGKLQAGRFDIWATGQYLGPYLASQSGVEIKELFTFRETVMSIACNKEIDQALINTLNETLQALKRRGVVDDIVARYR